MNKTTHIILAILTVVIAAGLYIRHHIKTQVAESLKNKKTDTIKLTVNRDSVAAGDDAYSHQITMNIGLPTTIETLLKSLAFTYPLPKISGGKATWMIFQKENNNKTRIGITAQQWETPKLLILPNTPIEKMASHDSLVIHFEYLAQQDPDTIFENANYPNDKNPKKHLKNPLEK